MTLVLVPLDPSPGSGDVESVHSWVVQERARFWMMQDHTLDEVREIYQWITDQPTHAAFLVREGEQRVALVQTYDPRAEEVGEHYDVRDGDVGVHLMLAPGGRPGLGRDVARTLAEHCFANPAVERVVAEPDARNERALALLSSVGFDFAEVVQLSMKPAQLGFLTRAAHDGAFAGTTSA